MYSIDFEYDGQRLSDFNGLLCNIDGGSSDGTIEYGVDITWNTVKVGNNFAKTSGIFESAYITTLSFAKNNCNDMNDYIFTDEEIAYIMRWLKKPQYKKFKVIYEDESFSDVYYMGVFTSVKPVLSAGNVIGFEVTLTTNSPYGYYEENVYRGNAEVVIHDLSDSYEYIYPAVSIECLEDGDLIIINEIESNRETIIANVVKGEVIEFSGITKQIKSTTELGTSSHNKLYNDFNYIYPRITTMEENIFSTNINANITIKYSPTAMIGII